MFELVEPIATITFSEVATDAFLVLGMRNYWDGYFAGPRRWVWHQPKWCTRSSTTSPPAKWRATSRGSGERLPRRRRSPCASGQHHHAAAGDRKTHRLPRPRTGRRPRHSSSPQLAVRRPSAVRRASGARRARRASGRLWHAAALLREHHGDGHNTAVLTHGISSTEAHVLLALSLGMKAEEFGRIHHLPQTQLAAVIDGLRGRGLVDTAGGFTDAGRVTSERIEALTDELAAPAYDVLNADELDELIAGLEPIAAAAQTVA